MSHFNLCVKLSAKFQKKVMKQSQGIYINFNFSPKWALSIIYTKYGRNEFAPKILNTSHFCLYECPTICTLLKHITQLHLLSRLLSMVTGRATGKRRMEDRVWTELRNQYIKLEFWEWRC